MKILKSQLKQIIKEEKDKMVREAFRSRRSYGYGYGYGGGGDDEFGGGNDDRPGTQYKRCHYRFATKDAQGKEQKWKSTFSVKFYNDRQAENDMYEKEAELERSMAEKFSPQNAEANKGQIFDRSLGTEMEASEWEV